ncbi:MAG: AraC family transcriptional regulator [Acetatifactor sp.]|nr:AraC family transcriptional regulator [Acetatifactor sp.]MDE7351855.1 AraC family transcriptional regulator [Acetatifactor sp.]
MKKGYILELQENTDQIRDKMVVKPYQQPDMEPHSHHFFELAYVLEGSAQHILNGKRESIEQGDYFIVDYGTSHGYQNSRDLTLINCLFLPEIIDDTLEGCKAFDELLQVCFIRYYRRYFSRVRTPVDRVFHDDDGRVLGLLLGLQKEYEERQIGYTEIFRSRLMEILILTMRRIIDQDTKKREQTRQSDAVLWAIQFFGMHYREHGLLEKFCREHHYSSQYISRKFHQETGMTVLEYIQRIRVEKSCEQIVGSDKSIREIAASAGYENMKYFNQVFRRMMHMSPGEYRKRALSFPGGRSS